MSLKKFNELFGVEEDMEAEKNRFVQRINQTIFNVIQRNPSPDNYQLLFRDICYKAGLNPDDLIARANKLNRYGTSLIIPRLRTLTRDDFFETLKILVILNESASSQNRDRVDQFIMFALGMATVDLGVRWKDGLFYPSGAKELDEKLIDDNLDWLKSLPKVEKQFTTSLSHFAKSLNDPTARKDAITNAYSSIEGMAQEILGNKKNFEKNSNELVKFLDLPSEYKNILHFYKQIAHNYSSRHAGSDFTHIETEAFIYMTGLLMRLVQQKMF